MGGAPAAAAALALCAGLLTGCGGSGKGSAAATPTTVSAGPTLAESLPTDMPQKPACGLIAKAEVEAAIGAKVNPGKEEAQPSRSVCSFTLVSGPTESVVVFSTSSSGVPAYFKSAKARTAAPAAVSAGDEAFVSGSQALVRKGSTMVAIVASLRRAPGELAAAVTKLAQAVGTHL